MCGVCGCGDDEGVTLTNMQTGEHTHTDAQGRTFTHTHDDDHGPHDHGHAHSHAAAHSHAHGHAHAEAHSHSHDHEHHHAHDHHDRDDHHHPIAGATTGELVEIQARVLAKNDALAMRNRAWFRGREILALNLVSSPGAGKTALLERTIRDLKGELPLFVIEGDQATLNDSERVRAAGAPAVQVNTGTGCHLEAEMVAAGVRQLQPGVGSLLMIENVGNLVCPALFDLGERAKVAILSVTEGEDKPLKYPHMFRAAELVLLNKVDLLPHLDFDIDLATANVAAVNPGAKVLRVSARTGEGLDAWYAWLREARAATRAEAYA